MDEKSAGFASDGSDISEDVLGDYRPKVVSVSLPERRKTTILLNTSLQCIKNN